jgi:hypothetical protein
VNFGNPFLPLSDLESDMVILKNVYNGVKGKILQNEYSIE